MISPPVIVLIITGYLFLTLPNVEPLKNTTLKVTALMQQRINEAAQQGKKLKIRQRWVSINRIPKLLQRSVRITEDASFYKHNGIDWQELKLAFKKNIQEKRFARGASTITQQLAKNLYLSTDKNLFRKLKEVFITYQMEKHLSKTRIMEIYLNSIEFGPGIFGVGAASYTYFGKHVSSLSVQEMVRLTAIIPKPLKVRPTSNARWLKWKARWIVKKLKLYKYITEDTYQQTIVAFN